MKHSMKKAFAAIMSVCTLATAAPAALNASAYYLNNMPNYPGDSNVWSTSNIFAPSFGNIPKGYVGCSYHSGTGRYWMVEKSSNIRMVPSLYRQRSLAAWVEFDTSKYIAKPNSSYEWTTTWGMDADWNQYAETMANVESVYSYYKDTLGLAASQFNFCGSSTAIYTSVYNKAGDARTLTENNKSFIGFGAADSSRYCMGADKGVVGHEFTHLYLWKKKGWTASAPIEVGAIMEAYCDILGELSEDTPDWLVAGRTYKTSSGNSSKPYCLRNMKAPKNTNTPGGTAGSAYYTTYNSFKTAINNGSLNNVNNAYALGSTVLTNAAYRMYNSGISKTDLAKIWYNSVNSLPSSNTTMNNCRNAVYSAAQSYFGQKYGYNTTNYWNNLNKVTNAFNAVGI